MWKTLRAGDINGHHTINPNHWKYQELYINHTKLAKICIVSCFILPNCRKYMEMTIYIFITQFWGRFRFLQKRRRLFPTKRFYESNPSISATATSTPNFWNTAATRGRGTPHEEIQRWDRKNAARIGVSGWWLNQPIWKILVKIGSFPQIGVENEKYLKPPPRFSNCCNKLLWISPKRNGEIMKEVLSASSWKRQYYSKCLREMTVMKGSTPMLRWIHANSPVWG